MSLKEQINTDIKSAMLAKEKDKLRALRSIKSLILLAETEKGSVSEINSDTEMKLLVKAAKQRKDSLGLYNEQGRDDLAKVESDELEIINSYLPKQLSEEEIERELNTIIGDLGASGPQDMGKVMGVATKSLAGKADGKTVSNLVRKILTA